MPVGEKIERSQKRLGETSNRSASVALSEEEREGNWMLNLPISIKCLAKLLERTKVKFSLEVCPYPPGIFLL